MQNTRKNIGKISIGKLATGFVTFQHEHETRINSNKKEESDDLFSNNSQ